MSQSQFDPAEFLKFQTTQASEKRPPLPVGEYTAMTGEVTCVQYESKKDPLNPKTGIRFNIPLQVEVPASVQADFKLGPTLTLYHSVFPDLTADGRGIDYSPGKSRGLREYREALGLNAPGQVFTPEMLSGRPVRVMVGAEQGRDGEPTEKILGVARA